MAVYKNQVELEACATDSSIIPNFTSTFLENSMWIAEAAEVEFNEMFKKIGVDELSIYESTGEVVVYEGAKLKAAKEGFIKFFQGLWKKIKGAYDRVLQYFETKRKEANESIIKDVNAADIARLESKEAKSGKISFGTIHTYPKGEVAESMGAKAGAYAQKVSQEWKAAVGKSDEDKENLKKNISERIISEVYGNGAKDLAAAKRILREQCLGEEVNVDIPYIKSHLEEMKSVVLKGSTKDAIKKSFQQSKTIIDNCISECKKFDDDMMPIAKPLVNSLKDINVANTTCMNIVMDVYKRRFSEFRGVLLKLKSADRKAGKEAEKAAKHESYAFQQDLIEAAFNF